MRTALANSLNIPAVKTLYFSSNMTKEPMAMMLLSRRLGISTFVDENGKPYNDFGLTLTLGGGEVKMIELAQVYAAFANAGKVIPTTPFLKIVNGAGKVLYDLNAQVKSRVVYARFASDAPLELPDEQGACPKSAPYAYLITDMLADNQARPMAFGPNIALKLSRPAAVETGTSNDFRDNWTMGYTPDLLLGVWVGNSDDTQMRNVSGISGAVPIWHNIMERVLAPTPRKDFAVPSGIVQATICTASGLLPTDLCPTDHLRKEFFVMRQVPTQHDDVWPSVRVDKDTGQLAGPNCPTERMQDQVFQVLPKDLDNLVSYDKILEWAKSAEWKLTPDATSTCS